MFSEKLSVSDVFLKKHRVSTEPRNELSNGHVFQKTVSTRHVFKQTLAIQMSSRIFCCARHVFALLMSGAQAVRVHLRKS